MGINRDRRRFDWEQASRRARSPEEAAERAHRGADLVRRALAGEQLPDPPAAAPKQREPRPAGYEMVGCVRCYTPIWALPGTRCDNCVGLP